MTDAQKTVSKSVTIDTPPAGTEISVSSSVPVNKDTKIKISLRPDLLEEYNAKYQKNYVMPPADSYTLSGDEVVGTGNIEGRIATGYLANLVAVPGKVDETFDALRQVKLVIHRGAIIRDER